MTTLYKMRKKTGSDWDISDVLKTDGKPYVSEYPEKTVIKLVKRVYR